MDPKLVGFLALIALITFGSVVTWFLFTIHWLLGLASIFYFVMQFVRAFWKG